MTEIKKSGSKTTEKICDEQRFPLEVLKSNCLKLFGITTSTFMGATVGLQEKTYTIKEIKEKITTWMKKEVR